MREEDRKYLVIAALMTSTVDHSLKPATAQLNESWYPYSQYFKPTYFGNANIREIKSIFHLQTFQKITTAPYEVATFMF